MLFYEVHFLGVSEVLCEVTVASKLKKTKQPLQIPDCRAKQIVIKSVTIKIYLFQMDPDLTKPVIFRWDLVPTAAS